MKREQEAALTTLMREVGALLKTYWPGDPANQRGRTLQISSKPDGTRVTEADLAANEILVAGLRKLFPDDRIFSEEGPQDADHRAAKRVWIIDPLDGTKSFIEGRDDFSVLVALSVDRVIEWGALYFPLKEIFGVGERGNGATINGIVPRVSASTELRDQSVYFRNFEPIDGPYLFKEWMDSGMAFLELARGGFDGIILKMTTHQEWDLAAPAALLEEAGGMMTDELGRSILFNQGKVGFQYLVASNGLVHEQLTALIPK